METQILNKSQTVMETVTFKGWEIVTINKQVEVDSEYVTYKSHFYCVSPEGDKHLASSVDNAYTLISFFTK